MYWTFATVSTTGFGDIVPVSNRERIYSMGSMLLGLTVFSYFITSVSNIVGIINAKTVRAANQQRVRFGFLFLFLQNRVLENIFHHGFVVTF